MLRTEAVATQLITVPRLTSLIDMVLHTFLGQLLLVAGYAFASPLELVSRGNAPVANPPVNTLPQDIPQGLLRDVALKFKPYLKVDLSSCCLPYPAVNPEGFTRQVLDLSHSEFSTSFSSLLTSLSVQA